MNPKLKQYEAGIEENIKPEDKEAYDRIVTAGMKLSLSEDMQQQMIDTLSGEGDLPAKVADGVARLISLMHTTSQSTMPIGPAIAASYTLMVKALDFAERALGQKVDDEVIAQTALATSEAVCKVFGISKEKLQAAVEQGTGGQPAAPAGNSAQPPTQQAGILGG